MMEGTSRSELVSRLFDDESTDSTDGALRFAESIVKTTFDKDVGDDQSRNPTYAILDSTNTNAEESRKYASSLDNSENPESSTATESVHELEREILVTAVDALDAT